MENRLEVPVEDRTGLQGWFAVDVTFNVPRLSSSGAADGVPALETAFVEELGLKLQRIKIPVDVTVIDRIERPPPN